MKYLWLTLFTTTLTFAAVKTELDKSVMPHKMITPSAGMRAHDGADAYLTADALYFEAIQEGMEYAITGVATSGATTDLPEGGTQLPDFKYEPGFRVGLGVGVGHDAWEVYAQYTWYQQTPKTNSISQTDNSVESMVLPPNLNFNVGSPLTKAEGDWDFKTSVLELSLGRDSFFSPYLAMKPFIGVKAVWQRQHFNLKYTWKDNGITTYNTIPQNMRVFGIGMRSGLNTLWSLNRNWSIYGNSAFSVIASRFKSDFINTQSTDTETAGQAENIGNKESTVQPIVELAMGIGWDAWFDDDAYHVGFRLGWEQQIWFHNNYFLTPSTPTKPGNLYLQGLVAKFRFDF